MDNTLIKQKMDERILFVNSEIFPYLPETHMSPVV